jgi:predicted nucleic acid-binding protein
MEEPSIRRAAQQAAAPDGRTAERTACYVLARKTSSRLASDSGITTLPDPSDDLVLEVAAHGQCDRIITFNTRDFAGSERFGIRVEKPASFLRSLGVRP